MVPTAGAVVCYGAGGGYSSLGHVAVVEAVFGLDSFEVGEMAYAAWDVVDHRASNMGDVVGFILPPGVAPGSVLAVAPGPAPSGLDGARAAYARLADFWNRGVPALVNELRLVAGQLGSWP
jgi:hypothetical protein